MDIRKKKKIIILGLCIGFAALLAVYLGLFADRETLPFEISKVYSLPLGENEVASVRRVIVSDLRGDGRKDVLISYDVASYEEQEVEGKITTMLSFKEARMLILSSDTTGDFQKSWEYSSGLTRQTVAVGDFDGNGKLDLIVGGFKAENEEDPTSIYSRVEVLLQKENSSFDNVFSMDIPKFILANLAVGEFVQNGKTSFVVGGRALENESPYHVYLFRNEGGGDFTMSPIALRERMVAEDIWGEDINGDGSLDLVIHGIDLDNETYPIILLLNDGQGGFEFQELGVLAGIPYVDPLVIEDFTGNTYPDIIYTKSDNTGSEVYLVRNVGGEFAETEPIGIRSEGIFVGMISADFNNDNTSDVLLLESRVEFKEEKYETNVIGHLIVIEKGPEGELSFTQKWSQKLLEGRDISPKYAVTAADIDNDGWIDLILVSGEGEVHLALNKHT
ncbi:MAG: VCBS repeat-containing protein [Dehalococcoidia bacterium]|nr:VCBS repeat-containing protein [Dehalococcoidia bacterium]